MQTFVQTDNFLFSDDDGLEADEVPNMADEPDIVPDSSDEASTGPALDMDVESDHGQDDVESPNTAIEGGINGYVHQGPTSSTRRAFKNTHMDYESNPATVEQRNLAVDPKSSGINKTPCTRDPDAGSSSEVGTSVATTEVVPSEREDALSEEAVSPATRPGMLGSSVLQGLRTETAAEAVKTRQRPKARPLVLASKEVREAVRGPSPPRATSPKRVPKASTSARPSDVDEEDELCLKRTKGHPTVKRAASGSKDGGGKAPRKAPGPAFDTDTDGEEGHPTAKPHKKVPSTKQPDATIKGKGRQVSDLDSDMTSNGSQAIHDDLKTIGQVMAKESEEDSDYNGKGEATDRWAKRSKRKKGQSKSSTAALQEPVHKSSSRLKKAKGQPSAVCSPLKSDGSPISSRDVANSDTEEPVKVSIVSKTARTGKRNKDPQCETRSSNGLQPRSKEFLDDEDMADDQITLPRTRIHEPTPIDTSKGSLQRGTHPGNSSSLSSNDEPVSRRPGSSKTYGKKSRKKANARLVDSEEEGESSEGDIDAVQDSLSFALVSRSPGNPPPQADNMSKVSLQTDRRRSRSPAYAVIIDNSPKKTRPPPSRGNRPPKRVHQEDDDDPAPAQTSTAGGDSLTNAKKLSRPVGKRTSTVRVIESDEEAPAHEGREREISISAEVQPAVESRDAIERSQAAEEEVSRSALHIKDINAAVSAQKLATDVEATGKTTLVPLLKAKSGTVDTKTVLTSTGKRFHDMVVAKGGGRGIKPQGLSKRSTIPSLLTFRGVPPPKKKPIPPAPIKKKKKGEEVYSDDDLEELNDQPEEWWEADDFYAWEQRKRKRAKAKGDIDSDDEREMTEKLKKTKKEESPVATGDATAEVEHLSD